MKSLRRVSVIEQTAMHLRERLLAGHWQEELPGVIRLAQEFQVSKNTVRAALRQLEQEGLLAANGQNGRAILTAEKTDCGKRVIRIGLLPRKRLADEVAYVQSLKSELQRELEAAGYECVHPRKSQAELGHNVSRIASMVRSMRVDMWVVSAGTEELLQWFAAQPIPVLAFGGRCLNVPIASVGIDVIEPMVEVTRRLIQLGHRRISFLCVDAWRSNQPGSVVQAFTAELSSHGIVPGEFNVPNWTESPEGLRTLLNTLFRLTPPTAIIVQHQLWAVGVLAFLAERGLHVPAQVSLIVQQPDPSHAWHYPPLAHFNWRTDLSVRRVVRWVGAIAEGRMDRESVGYPVEFEPGGTIGPPPNYSGGSFDPVI